MPGSLPPAPNLHILLLLPCESPDIFPHLCSLWLEVGEYLCIGKGHVLLKRDQLGRIEINVTRNENLPRLL